MKALSDRDYSLYVRRTKCDSTSAKGTAAAALKSAKTKPVSPTPPCTRCHRPKQQQQQQQLLLLLLPASPQYLFSHRTCNAARRAAERMAYRGASFPHDVCVQVQIKCQSNINPGNPARLKRTRHVSHSLALG